MWPFQRESPDIGSVLIGASLAVTGLFMHFAWEMWQVPFFQRFAGAAHQDVVWLSTRAAVGDVMISLGALGMLRLLGHVPLELIRLKTVPVILWLVAGLLATVAFEIHATQ